MRHLLALLLFLPSLCLAQSVTLPYNPDANADSAIGAPDLLEMLPLFGGYFTPDPILIDGMEINEYLNMLEANGELTPHRRVRVWPDAVLERGGVDLGPGRCPW